MSDGGFEGYIEPHIEAEADQIAVEDGILRQDTFNKYIQIVARACRRIEDLYFNVPIVTDISQDEYVSVLRYRERVYCYELYHQQRLLLEQDEHQYSELLLNAETDKSGTVYSNFVAQCGSRILCCIARERAHTISRRWK